LLPPKARAGFEALEERTLLAGFTSQPTFAMLDSTGGLTAIAADTGTNEIQPFPEVDAGANQSIVSPATANLDATVDATATSSLWVKVSGPGSVRFGNTSAVDTTANFSEAGEYVLRLVATNGRQSGADDVSISVIQNQPPLVNAGPDETIKPSQTARLAGLVEDDGLPGPPAAMTVLWSQVSGPGTVSFGDTSRLDTTANFSRVGTYVLRLMADDGELSESDDVTIMVGQNQPPVVDAGGDLKVIHTETVRLRGTATDDRLPDPPANLTTRWSQVSGPGSVKFSNSASLSPQASFSAPGTFILRLTANDGLDESSDDVVVTVLDSAVAVSIAFQDGVAPTIDYAGTGDTTLLREEAARRRGGRGGKAKDTQIRLSGVQDSSGLIRWDLRALPLGTEITSAAVIVNVLDGSTNGYEMYQLRRDWLEQPPRGLPIANWEIDGALGESDRGFVELGKLSAPNLGLATIALNAAGLAVVQSWVDDPALNFGIIVQDYNADDPLAFSSSESRQPNERPQLRITYKNNPPIVNAGPDQTVMLPDRARLDGLVGDDALPLPPQPVQTTWSVVSGPGRVTFSDAAAVDTRATFDIGGHYVLRLTANDGRAQASDDVLITVQQVREFSFQDGLLPATSYSGTRDTVLDSTLPDSNFDDDPDARVDGTPPASTLLEWDIRSIPRGSLITGASITLDVVNTSADVYEIFGMVRDWTESEATWNRPVAGVTWESAGALGTGDRIPFVLGSVSFATIGQVTAPLNSDGIAFVQSWLDDPSINFGIIIQGEPADSDRAGWSTREFNAINRRPKLTVHYTSERPPEVNQAPVVDAGPDRAAGTVNPITLTGTSSDDGLPNPPGLLTALWSVVSGPGNVTFGDALSETTTARFSAPGTYVLRLEESDSLRSDSDEITVQVSVSQLFQDGVSPAANYDGTRDTRIDSSFDRNFGTSSPLGLDGSPPLASLLRWDTELIPPGALVQAAAITINITNTSADPYQIYAINRDWTETGATWTEALPGVGWQTEGAQGTSDRGSVAIGTVTATSLGPTTIQLNSAGVALVQKWINEPGTNFGVVFQNYSTATDRMEFSSRESSTSGLRPSLTLDFFDDIAPPANQPPVVNSGPDQVLSMFSTATLSGVVTDDDLPGRPSRITSMWSVVSGPGTVTFANPAALATTATFSKLGVYKLRLTASDSELTASDEVRVTVAASESFQDGNFPTVAYAGTRDTSIDSVDEDLNFGTAAVWGADGRITTSAIGGLVRWDVSSLSQGSAVQSASITLDVTNTSDDTYEIYALLQPWQETGATWNQFATGEDWQSPGARSSSDRGSVVLGSVTATTFGTITIELNQAGVTIVQSWINDPSTNHGLLFADYTNSSNHVEFSSRETLNVAARPKLTINFLGSTAPDVNQGPMVNAGVDQAVNSGTGAMLAGIVQDDGLPNPPRSTSTIWSVESGPGTVTFDDTTKTATRATFSYPGTYVLRLTAADSQQTATDTLTISVVGNDSFQDGASPNSSYLGTQDTTIDGALPSTRFGTNAELAIDGSPDAAALLRWDIRTIPAGVVVQSASIIVNVTNGSLDTFNIYALNRDWSESSATWRNSQTGSRWEIDGAAGPADRGDVVIGQLQSTSFGRKTITLNAAGLALVQSWIDDAATNFGVIFVNPDSHDSLHFNSSDAQRTGDRPKLAVQYDAPNSGPIASQTSRRSDSAALDLLLETMPIIPLIDLGSRASNDSNNRNEESDPPFQISRRHRLLNTQQN